jgi:uncharacterized protein YoxC
MFRLVIFALASASLVAETPVAKVNRLLTEMKEQLDSDAKADADLFEKMECWCTTNEKEKTAAVATAEKSITTLTGAIESLTAKSAELKATIARVQKSVDKSKAALDKATSIREKENAEFTASEKELLESTASVDTAIQELGKHNSFLQVSKLSDPKLKEAVMRHQHLLAPKRRRVLLSLLQQPVAAESYNSRSGEIFGIMKEMKETFETSLATERGEEGSALGDFNGLAAAKNKEIAAGKEQMMDKTAELAETDEELAHSKHELEKTQDSLSADQKFLIDLTGRCENADKEYQERMKMRNTEIAAVADAIAIVQDDSSRDLFERSLGTFIQVSKVPQGAQRKLSQALKAAAKSATGVRKISLLALASTAKIEDFSKITASIEQMVVDLKKEQDDEVAHQRFCTEELSENAAQQASTKEKIEDLTAEIEEKNATVETLASEIAVLQEQVSEMNKQLKRASEDRALANKEFQLTVADQRATQEVLERVLTRLGKVYAAPEKKDGEAPAEAAAEEAPAFVQVVKHKQPDFGAYTKNESGGGVMSLIQEIMHEAVTLEKEGILAEQNAQNDYEAFVAETAKSIGAANRSISAKASAKADLEQAIVAASEDKAANIKKLMDLGKYETELHSSCDYVLKNFDLRQEARAEEMDALNSAKAILAGAGTF